MELQGSASTSSGMQDMSLIDYCSPNSNGNMNRDPMDDQYDEVAYSFDFGKSSPDFPVKGEGSDDALSADDDDSPFDPDDEERAARSAAATRRGPPAQASPDTTGILRNTHNAPWR